MAENPKCTWCGCKGKKSPHTRIIDQNTAKQYGWKDMICGSCGRPFRSYKIN